MKLADVAEAITSRFGGGVTGREEFRDELGFDFLLDISSIDHFEHEPRYEIVYELYSLANGLHLRLKTTATEDHPEVPTVCDLWPTAN